MTSFSSIPAKDRGTRQPHIMMSMARSVEITFRCAKTLYDLERATYTCFALVMNVVTESVVEGEVGSVRVNERHRGDLRGQFVLDARVVDHHSLDVVVLCVVLLNHRVGYIRAVLSSIGLSSNVDLSAVKAKEVHEVAPERKELIRNVNLVCGVRRTLGETSSNRLLDEDHVGQIVPSISVGHRAVSACLPNDGAVLVEEAIQRRASGATCISLGSSRVLLLCVDSPFSQMVISSLAAGLVEGTNQKKSSLVLSIGSSPL